MLKKTFLLISMLLILSGCSQKTSQVLRTDMEDLVATPYPEAQFQNQYQVWAYVVGVYDGDTVDLLFQSGVNNWQIWSTRLLDIDAPEVRGKEKELGFITRDWLADQVLGKWILVKMPGRNLDKYGRLLVTLFSPNYNDLELSVNLNQKMIDLGLVEPYDKAKALEKSGWTPDKEDP